MADYYRQFDSGNGGFVRFSITDQRFVVLRGQGNQVKSRDFFSLQDARKIAYDILHLTGEYRQAHKGNMNVQKAFLNDNITDRQAMEIIDDVAGQAPENPRLKQVRKAVRGEINQNLPKTRDIEKVKEQVIDNIYQTFGTNKFTHAQFKEMYNAYYDRGQAKETLHRLKNTSWLIAEEPSDDMDVSPYTTYVYRLSDWGVKAIESMGGELSSEDNEYFQWKKHMIPEEKRPKAVQS